MTGLLEGARRRLSRRTDLDGRVAGLTQAAEAARGRLPDQDVDRVLGVTARASARLRLSADHTVVALAGATGSGKSSTFNQLSGLDVAAVGVRRPTTSWATACIWGATGAAELLEWLGIPIRHQVSRDSMLDVAHADADLDGLVLLDLPDHDSTEVSHHLEVDRLVELADLLIWILDPQKYADAAIHDRFLRPLNVHRDVMLIVLNHIDEVAPDRRGALLADLQRVLDTDGLAGVPVLPTSALTGEGIDDLRKAIAGRVADKASTRHRIATDIAQATQDLASVNGDAPVPAFAAADRERLVEAVCDAAGVPVVVEAVRAASARRARQATGWPVTAWLGRLRPDPLKRLHLERSGGDATVVPRTSVPAADRIQLARVDSRVRDLADSVGSGLSRPWASAIRRASTSHTDQINDRLDRAVAETELGVDTVPMWCRAVRGLQWLLMVAALGGGLWLLALAVLGTLRLPQPDPPQQSGVPLPTLLFVGGVVLGILLALVSRGLVAWGARARARRVERRLRIAVAAVTDDLVIGPIAAELDAYRKTREGLALARR